MDKSVKNIKKSWNELYSIILTTVMISAGISLLVLGVGNIIGQAGNVIYIVIGIVLIIGPLCITFFIGFKKSNRNYLINAVVAYDRNSKELISIRDYEFMEELCRHMQSAILEDKNIKAMWKKDTLGINGVVENPTNKEQYVNVSRSAAVLNQLIEYLLLKKLGLVTSAYFNKPKFNKRKIVQIERSDIDGFVANNMFINLFTKPTHERAAFDNEAKDSNVVYCFGKNHAIYDKFELLLPHKCKIERNNNTVIVKHPYFRLKITPAFTGFGEVLPKGFEKRYMKCKSEVRSYKVWIGIELQFTWKAMLMNKDQYYGWIDEYIENLNEYASFKHFKERIQWDMTNAIMSCLELADEC